MLLRWTMLAVVLLGMMTGGRGAEPAPFATWTFGVSLMTGMNNELFTLFVVKEFEGRVIATEPITREQFVLQVQGAIPSKANPGGENLFLRYLVTECVRPDNPTVPVRDCDVFDRIWKLRFWEYPYHMKGGGHPGRGWAENPSHPSERQLLLLSNYGMERFMDLVYGENCFRLLRDLGDTAWVDNYRQGY